MSSDDEISKPSSSLVDDSPSPGEPLFDYVASSTQGLGTSSASTNRNSTPYYDYRVDKAIQEVLLILFLFFLFSSSFIFSS